MSIWSVPDVGEEPETALVSWRIKQTHEGYRHLVGYAAQTHEGCVSSRLQSFDTKQLRAVSASGRVYRLEGGPGHHPDADYVWQVYAARYVVEHTDISERIWAAHCRLAGVTADCIVLPPTAKESP